MKTTLQAFSATLLLLALITVPANAQTGSITGTVTDAGDGQTLIGAAITVHDRAGNQLTGSTTDAAGIYTISGVAAGQYTVRARFVGYSESSSPVTVSSGQTATVDFVMSAGVEMDMIVVSGSRAPEKVLEAPASISVLTAEDIAADVGTSSVEALRTTTGVDMAQTGIDRREMVLRGFNNAFSGAAFVLTDYRQAAVPSLGVNIYSIMPNINIDVDRVEVVRGPGSALYGPGVDAGVVHFITKGPFEHPGTTVSVSAGERSYMGVQFRHAGTANEKFGYKITGTYGQADDWEMDPSDPIDSVQLAGDVIPRNSDFEKLNINANFEFRPKEGTSIIGNFGQSALTASVLSGIGTVQADGFGYRYGQLRFLTGNFFAQIYANQNDAGDSFVYDQDFAAPFGEPDPVVDNGMQINFQAQYDYEMSAKQSFILGVDADLTRPDTEGTILGRNETMDDINEYGAYVQSQTAVTPKLDLVLALRTDYNDVQETNRLSPRAALVFKPANNHSLRATFNRAFSSPGTNSNFLDIVAQSSPLIVRGRGSAQGFTWERDASYLGQGAITDLVASSLLPTSLGQRVPVGADLGEMYGLIYAGLSALSAAQVQGILALNGINVPEATAGQLLAALSPANTTVSGFTPGIMSILNLTTLQPASFPDDLADVEPLKQTTTQTIEVGYKGFIGNKLAVAIDGYYTEKENFVGPLLLETPLVLVPNLGPDLTAALAAGINGSTGLITVAPGVNLPLAQALGALGVPAANAAALIVGIAEPDFPSAVGIVSPAENNTGAGNAPEMMLTYRNFGKLSYAGIDASFTYFHSEALEIFGNVSYVNDDFFDSSELEEDNTDLALSLNATSLKGRFGVKYKAPSGLSANLALRHTDGFPIRSGPYVGDLPAYTLIDIGLGYDLGDSVPGMSINVGVNNALNEEHREFIGAPLLGRMVIGRLTYSF